MKKVRDDGQDTIAAIATPVGEAAVGVIRISGKWDPSCATMFAVAAGWFKKFAVSRLVW